MCIDRHGPSCQALGPSRFLQWPWSKLIDQKAMATSNEASVDWAFSSKTLPSFLPYNNTHTELSKKWKPSSSRSSHSFYGHFGRIVWSQWWPQCMKRESRWILSRSASHTCQEGASIDYCCLSTNEGKSFLPIKCLAFQALFRTVFDPCQCSNIIFLFVFWSNFLSLLPPHFSSTFEDNLWTKIRLWKWDKIWSPLSLFLSLFSLPFLMSSLFACLYNKGLTLPAFMTQ